MSVWLAQFVKALVAPLYFRSCVEEVRVRSPPAYKFDSGFRPSGIGKMKSNYLVVGWLLQKTAELKRGVVMELKQPVAHTTSRDTLEILEIVKMH